VEAAETSGSGKFEAHAAGDAPARPLHCLLTCHGEEYRSSKLSNR